MKGSRIRVGFINNNLLNDEWILSPHAVDDECQRSMHAECQCQYVLY